MVKVFSSSSSSSSYNNGKKKNNIKKRNINKESNKDNGGNNINNIKKTNKKIVFKADKVVIETNIFTRLRNILYHYLLLLLLWISKKLDKN
jgi:hypothetical protein